MAKELTKQALMQSCMKLLDERPIDRITVKDIVTDCGINRITFYYHYEDIYALVSDVIETETENIAGNSRPSSEWKDVLTEAARFALSHKRAVYNIYNSPNRDRLERRLRDTSRQIMENYIRLEAEGLSVSEDDIRFISRFYGNAVMGIVYGWLEHGMKDDAEADIARLVTLFDGSVRSALERAAKK